MPPARSRSTGTTATDRSTGPSSSAGSARARTAAARPACPGWLDSAPTLTAEQTRLVDLQLVGNYALCPSWGDGHHTGYYTFESLRHHCPCPTCTAVRQKEPA